MFPHDGDAHEALLAIADSRMYRDKRVGKTDAARRVVAAADAVGAVDDIKSRPA